MWIFWVVTLSVISVFSIANAAEPTDCASWNRISMDQKGLDQKGVLVAKRIKVALHITGNSWPPPMDDPNVRMGYAVIMVMEMDKFCKQNSRVELDAAFAAAAANINQKAQADPDYQKSQRDRAETPEIFGPHGIIAVGSFRYSVDKSYWRESVKQYPYDLVFPDGIFLFVEIGIMNVDRQELTIPQFTLKDLAGREYGTTSKAWFLRNRLSGLERLNPGIWKFATIVFDVPRQAYRLQVTGGYGSQQRALIELQPSEATDK